MCGIAGFNLSPTETIDPQLLATALLLGIEARGTDATGAAWFDRRDEVVYLQKAAVPAHAFAPTLVLPPGVRNVILHARAASVGHPSNDENNHPIEAPGITGVHNGTLINHEATLARLRRQHGYVRRGRVDSEAIFGSLAVDDRPVVETLADMDGRMAVAWIDHHRPRSLNLARGSTSPISMAWTPHGSLVFASTGPILRTAARMAGWKNVVDQMFLREGTYVRVLNGDVKVTAAFVPRNNAGRGGKDQGRATPGPKARQRKPRSFDPDREPFPDYEPTH